MRGLTSINADERKAVALAFICNFSLLAGYYMLRPVRDTIATAIGVGQLPGLFTATFIGTFIACAVYAAVASRVRLALFIPGVFALWLVQIVAFAALFRIVPATPWLNNAFYVWFSVVNLFMISVFWSLMVDLFSSSQASRLFPLIAAGGALGAIVGPLITRLCVARLQLSGMLALAAAVFLAVCVLVALLTRQKAALRLSQADTQRSSLEHALPGRTFEGFGLLFTSSYVRGQAIFILLMTWVNTVAYFCQTDFLAQAVTSLAGRAQIIADIDLIVNACTAIVLLGGLGKLVRRYGVTAGLILNPLLMIPAFVLTALSPTLLMLQVLQVVRRVAQYAIARPTREICFTVVEQSSRYKAKSVVDTLTYRFGDLSSAWMQAGMRTADIGLFGTVMIGALVSLLWAGASWQLGARYERRRAALASQ